MAMQADDPRARATPGGPRPPSGGARGPSLSGRRIGTYDVQDELGRGGMGVVYRARDRSLDREVAIKVLLPQHSRDEEFERRFVREARAAAKLEHPNIVQVYTAGRFEDVLFIAMQLVRGRTLQDLLRQRKRLPVREALRIVRQSAEALREAHKVALVHRDIKPNNIMIDEAGRVKIMDFGLMRSSLSREAITRSGEFFGTPEYASPEQCETSVLDGRSDLYSLGAVLYEMLTGRMPYSADTPMSLFKKILEEEPPPVRSLRPDVPPAVEALVRKMMAKKREERFASAAEVIAAIDRALAGGTRAVPAKPRRFPWVPAAAAAAVAVLAAVAFWPAKKPAPPSVPLAAPAPKPDRMKLVVFDLRSGIPQEETAWYEIALSDMLIASLSQHPFLEIPTRDMLLWKLKEMRLDGPVAGDNRRILTHELGAAAYLSGAYYVQGGKVRMTLSCYRLPENAPAFPVKSFDRSDRELFALVDEAAAEVARELEGVAAGIVTEVRPAAEPKTSRELAFAFGGEAPRQDSLKKISQPPAPEEARKAAPAPAAPEAKAAAGYGMSAERPGAGAGTAPPAASLPQMDKAQADEKREALAGKKNENAERALVLAEEQLKRRAVAGRDRDAERGGPPGDPRGSARGEQELVKAWYQNRQALEKYRFDKDEFDALFRALRRNFQGAEPHEAELKDGTNRTREAGAQGALRAGRLSVEFFCSDCRNSSPSFGACPDCGKYRVFRVQAAPDAQEKKE